MRVRIGVIAPIVCLVLLTGCQKSNREKLQGVWVGESVRQVHDSQVERADGWAKGTRIEFAGNKVTVAIPTESARSGTFKLAKAEGQDMDVVFKRPEGGEDKTRLRFSDDGKLLLALGGGSELVMRKE